MIRVLAAVAALAAAAILIAIAVDVGRWEASGSRHPATLAGGTAERLLGTSDDVALRRAVLAFVAAERTPYGFDNGLQQARVRALAEAQLAGLAGHGFAAPGLAGKRPSSRASSRGVGRTLPAALSTRPIARLPPSPPPRDSTRRTPLRRSTSSSRFARCKRTVSVRARTRRAARAAPATAVPVPARRGRDTDARGVVRLPHSVGGSARSARAWCRSLRLRRRGAPRRSGAAHARPGPARDGPAPAVARPCSSRSSFCSPWLRCSR